MSAGQVHRGAAVHLVDVASLVSLIHAIYCEIVTQLEIKCMYLQYIEAADNSFALSSVADTRDRALAPKEYN